MLFSPLEPHPPLFSYDIFTSGYRYMLNRIMDDLTSCLACGAGAAVEEEVWSGRHCRGIEF